MFVLCCFFYENVDLEQSCNNSHFKKRVQSKYVYVNLHLDGTEQVSNKEDKRKDAFFSFS